MSSARILVVYDDPQIRRVLRTKLVAQGYEVVDARNGETPASNHKRIANGSRWRHGNQFLDASSHCRDPAGPADSQGVRSVAVPGRSSQRSDPAYKVASIGLG